eukprot:Rmarinus@m.1433
MVVMALERLILSWVRKICVPTQKTEEFFRGFAMICLTFCRIRNTYRLARMAKPCFGQNAACSVATTRPLSALYEICYPPMVETFTRMKMHLATLLFPGFRSTM